MMRRVLGLILSFALLFILISVGVNWQYQRLLHEKRTSHVHLVIKNGQGLDQIARQLQHEGVISSAYVFRLYTRWQHQEGAIKAGEYAFDGALNMIDVLQMLSEGKVVTHQVTVAEGLRTADILNKLAQQTGTDIALWQSAMHELVANDESEGVLLPETYRYEEPVNPRAILHQMMRAQQTVLDALQLPSPKETIVIASIIEKETALSEERPLVSAVIRNRLKQAMPLQMDPTVIYGLWRENKGFSGSLHHNDLEHDTPWNSYTRSGLPPTPICNPGRDSIRAAAEPADVQFLYFVANGKGGHSFAVSHQEHQRNIRRWLKERKATASGRGAE